MTVRLPYFWLIFLLKFGIFAVFSLNFVERYLIFVYISYWYYFKYSSCFNFFECVMNAVTKPARILVIKNQFWDYFMYQLYCILYWLKVNHGLRNSINLSHSDLWGMHRSNTMLQTVKWIMVRIWVDSRNNLNFLRFRSLFEINLSCIIFNIYVET